MRWSRLLLSRELPVSNGLCLRLWDYLFASAVSFGGSIASDADTAVGASSGDEERERGGTNEKAFRRRLDAPLLVALGHVIMAMLVQVTRAIHQPASPHLLYVCSHNLRSGIQH